MARFSIDEDDEDAPIVHKRPRFSQSPSQSQFAEEGGEDEWIPLEDVDSDSQGLVEEDDEEFEATADEEEEDGGTDDGGDDDDDDEGTEAVMEGQNHQQQTTVSMVDSSQLGQNQHQQMTDSSQLRQNREMLLSGAIQVVLTDPDVLDCPICLDPLCSPVFQCENGHIACSSCCSKVKRKCPSCCMPIGYNRCRAIEKVIESVKTSCKNARYGCKETMLYNKKIEHEQTCPHATCFCPNPSCTFAGSSKNLYLHFGIHHAASTTRFTYNTTFTLYVQINQKHAFLQEQHESVIFILNHGVQENGRTFNLDCLGPSTLRTAFMYRLTVKCMETSLSLQSAPEVFTKWSEHTPNKNYLTIPPGFPGHTGQMYLYIRIRKLHD